MRSILVLLALVSASSAHALDISFKSCAVVETGPARNTVLEEGLGSIYELDWDGYADADGDSTSGSVEIEGKNVKLRLGQGGWGTADDYIQITSFTYRSEMTGQDAEGVDLEVEYGTAHALYFRIFPDYKIVMVRFTGGKYKNSHLATLDCSGVRDVRERLKTSVQYIYR